MLSLPVDTYLKVISEALNRVDALIVKAPPGTGKTTRVPAHLAFDIGLKTVVLEPRRIAARQAGLRVAAERDLKHGHDVGHAFRYESHWCEETMLLFATEGTFLNLLEKSSLTFDVVIIDEFHERHLDTDLALALLVKRGVKIVVMSATLEGLDLETYFTRAGRKSETIDVASVLYPCEVKYLENTPSILKRSLELKVLNAMDDALEFGGDILCFLPGVREIQNVRELLMRHYPNLNIIALHAKLSVAEQAQAFERSEVTKVILATNVAESSLTIPGVKVVIDSGMARESKWSPWSRLSVLEVIKVAQSSAIQRMGRALREAPGLCLRLYAELDFHARQKNVSPEIERSSLDKMRLRLLAMKENDHEWFEVPPEKAWTDAMECLVAIGALSAETSEITNTGREINHLPLDPSWARVAMMAKNCDIRSRRVFYQFLAQQSGESFQALSSRLDKILGPAGSQSEPLGKILLCGFVRALARLRGSEVITCTGKILKLAPALHHEFLGEEWGIIFDVDAAGRVHKFIAIDTDWTYELEPLPFIERKTISWDQGKGLVLCDTLAIGTLIFEERQIAVQMDQVPAALREDAQRLVIKASEAALLRLQKGSRWARLCYLHQNKNESDDLLKDGITSFIEAGFDLEELTFYSYLELQAAQAFNIDIEKSLPFKIGKLEVTYLDGSDPFIMAMIQDFYGLSETPRLPLTQESLLLKLQGPHRRPLQVTSDLAGFWRRGYLEFLKEMRREYPRHHWPDNPETAPAILLKRQLPKD